MRDSATFGGTTASLSYDHMGRIVKGRYATYYSQTPQLFGTWTYGAWSRRESLARPNGVVTNYSYDPVRRLTGLAHSAPSAAAASVQAFGYNPAGETVLNEQKTDAYVWTGQPTTTVNYTHDQLNRDAAIAAASGYDTAGNLTSDGTRSFTYDVENRLRSVTGGPSNITLDYDAFGRLAKTTVGSTVTSFRYAGLNLAAEYNGSGTLLRSYVSGQNVDEWWLWTEGTGGSAQAKWFAQDRLGSVIGVSDSAGAVTPYAYGPYGEPQNWAGSRFRYTGQIAIPEAQVYHYRARAYDDEANADDRNWLTIVGRSHQKHSSESRNDDKFPKGEDEDASTYNELGKKMLAELMNAKDTVFEKLKIGGTLARNDRMGLGFIWRGGPGETPGFINWP